MDQERDDDLPLTIACLEITSGYPYGEIDDEYHYRAEYILLQATENDMEFRRLGSAMFNGAPQPEDYLFFGIEKTIIALM